MFIIRQDLSHPRDVFGQTFLDVLVAHGDGGGGSLEFGASDLAGNGLGAILDQIRPGKGEACLAPTAWEYTYTLAPPNPLV